MRIIIDWVLPKSRYEFRPVNDLSSTDTGLVNQAYNFDVIDMIDSPDKILRVLVSSIKNMRKVPQNLDMQQKRVQVVTQQMRRTSYMAELEALYVYALNCKNMSCGTSSPFMLLI